MATKNITVSGTVTISKTGFPLANVKVVAWDKDPLFDDKLGEAVTDDSGHFSITFEQEKLEDVRFGMRWESYPAEVYFEIRDYTTDELLGTTKPYLLKQDEEAVTDFDITVDVPGSTPDKSLLFAIYDAAGEPVKNLPTDSPVLLHLKYKAAAQLKREIGLRVKTGTTALREHISILNLIPWAGGDLQLFLKQFFVPFGLSRSLLSEVSGLLKELSERDLFKDPLRQELRVRDNPLLLEEFQLATVLVVANTCNLADAKLDLILGKVPNLLALNDQLLNDMVTEGQLIDSEARAFGLATNLYQLLDEHLPLSSALSVEIASIRDLAKFSLEQWLAQLTAANVTPPEGETLETYAQSIMGRVAALYPTTAFFNLIVLADLQTLIENLPELSSENQIKIANRFPKLGLKDLLFNETMSWDEKIVLIGNKLNLLNQFWLQNEQIELLALDYSPGSQAVADLNMEGFSNEEQQTLLASLRAYQRIFALTRDTEQMPVLLEAGYDSGTSIANVSFADFLTQTGLGADAAQRCYQTAWSAATSATLNLSTVIDFLYGRFDWIRAANQTPEGIQDFVNSFLRQIDGFDDLFGNQTYCKCEHCRSILSPAAYFVDLMYFVQQNVINTVFRDKQDHPLNLKKRRPDLWSLQLSCPNTNDLVPTLDIIIEILENFIAQTSGFSGDIHNRGEVEKVVYEQVLIRNQNSFILPFVLPLERLETYLKHFSLTRADVAQTLGIDGKIWAAAKLKFVREEYDRLTRTENDLGTLSSLYDISFVEDLFGIVKEKIIKESKEIESEVDVQKMLDPMRLSRSQFGELIATQFVQAGSIQGRPIAIVSGKSDANSVQNDIEYILNLTADALDRMYRFTRLWRHTPWSMCELDLVIAQLWRPSLPQIVPEWWLMSMPPKRVPGTLELVADVWSLQERFGMSIEALCSFFSDIPQETRPDLQRSLFDRLFNISQLQQADGGLAFPSSSDIFVHPALNPDNLSPASSTRIHRLLAGLQVSDEQLCQLITLIPAFSNKQFHHDVGNLSILFRHARLAEFLKLSLPDLFQLLGLAGIDNGISCLADLQVALDFYDWWKSTAYTLDDLVLFTGGKPQNEKAYPNSWTIACNIIDELRASNALVFAETVFAGLSGMTESDSLKIIEDNEPAIIEPFGTGYRLTPKFNALSQITIPERLDGVVSGDDVKKILLGYHPDQIIPNRLAPKLRISVENMRQFIAMSGFNLFEEQFVAELWSVIENKLTIAPGKLSDLIKQIIPQTVLFRNSIFDTLNLDFVSRHRAIFGIPEDDASEGSIGFIPLPIEAVRRLSIYTDILDNTKDADFSTAQVSISADDLRDVLIFGDANKFVGLSEAQYAQLARVTEVDTSLLRSLLSSITTLGYALPDSAIHTVKRLRESATLARTLGITGSALLNLVPIAMSDWGQPEELPSVADCYAPLSSAADAIFGVFRAKYLDEKIWEAKIEPFENLLRSRKRDALVEHLLRAYSPLFESADDLYYYFLIDVKLEGCARTSRVVSAISSVQLYVHRILMNLEQDRNNPPLVHVKPTRIPRDEWEWRSKYRVWEANRKVFLYPENYLEPSIRDDKTPLFETLESELLAQDINEQTVLDAYANYLKGFDEVATLKIAGVYHDRSSDPDIMHLIGVTPADPPIYYYRTVENLYLGAKDEKKPIVWSHWRKINVQIPVRKAAPVIYQGRLHLFWVQWRTKPRNALKNGKSTFTGYEHRMSLSFSTLNLDGTWTSPQPITIFKGQWPFENEAGLVWDPLEYRSYEYRPEIKGVASLDDLAIPHAGNWTDGFEPIEGYELDGTNWDEVFLHADISTDIHYLELAAQNFWVWARVDFRKRLLGGQKGSADIVTYPKYPKFNFVPYVIGDSDGNLYYGYSDQQVSFSSAYANIIIDPNRIYEFNLQQAHCPGQLLQPNYLQKSKIATVDDGVLRDAMVVAYTPTTEQFLPSDLGYDVVLQPEGDVLLLQNSRTGLHWLLKRIGTTLSDQIVGRLFEGSVDDLLNTSNQLTLKESQHNVRGLNDNSFVSDLTGAGNRIDFLGPYGVYYREIFFHIPYLIANHLNSQGRYAAAQQWYRYIFDPTAEEDSVTDDETIPATNRNWRYAEFRAEFESETIIGLRKMLTDPKTLVVWNKDPFNPHAIARSRLSAYQKCVVMKYIDNLLDWGDSLFSQFTMESVNEATLLYVLAADLLGPRPPEIGECGQSDTSTRIYEAIAPWIDQDNGFLIEMETQRISGGPWVRDASMQTSYTYIDSRLAKGSVWKSKAGAAGSTGTGDEPSQGAFRGMNWNRPHIASWTTSSPGSMSPNHVSTVREDTSPLIASNNQAAYFLQSMARQIGLVFCIPVNKELLDYWDRVENRLFNIRNCRDIKGVRRDLALFEPEIDPRLLIRMKAAGLSLEDVLNVTSGNLPPYRFAYLIEKAKSYAATLQNFGNALLSALEKKDVEELNKLKLVHEQNLQTLTRQIRNWEVEEAQRTIDELDQRKAELEYRESYYQNLIDSGLLKSEQNQLNLTWSALSFASLAALFDQTSAKTSLAPQMGSPFSLNWGGIQMGGFFRSWSGSSNDIERVLSIAATSQGITSNNQRRTDAWSHELKLVGYELEQNKTRKKAAEFHRDIQIKSREIHEKSIVQTEEIYTFYANKFSDFGLYTWLSSTLQRLFREAYNSAYSMAKLAEQAFRFERDEESDLIAGSGYWDPAYGGLLSGEQLMLALETLEKRYIETNYRRLEIDQAFSLAQLDQLYQPYQGAALQALRDNGECEIVLPEFEYDRFYPGHYRRKIKAVRVTLPCVTGPYTNVSATLRLIDSKVRIAPTMDSEALVSVPPQRTVSIAMSSGNNDAGVFELNFHDERYMPFEGAGAISTWKLKLPQSIPPFDYQTITDVVMRISYTAQEDESLRLAVDGLKGQIESSLIQYLSKNAMRRVFSLRDEFAKEFVKLTASPPGTAVIVSIPATHFPFFLRSAKIGTIKVEKAKIAVRAGQENGISDLKIEINSTTFDGFHQSSDLFSDIRNNYTSEAETDKRNFDLTKSGMDNKKGDDLWISNAKTPIDWVVDGEGGFALSLTFSLNNATAQVSPEKDNKEAALDIPSIQDILLCIEYTIVKSVT